MSLTPVTITGPIVGAIGGTMHAQLTATLHNPSGVLPGTPVGPRRDALIGSSGGYSLACYRNDDTDSQPSGTAWKIWGEVETSTGKYQLAPVFVQLTAAHGSSVSLGALTPATTTVYQTYIPLSQKGAANGVAPLDSDGMVPAEYLPATEGALLAENNLSDVTDPAAARANIGAVSAAFVGQQIEDFGAYVDDQLAAEALARTTGDGLLLAKADNLASLADKPTARGNLGLGAGALLTQAQLLKDWAAAQAFTATAPTYDATYTHVVASAPVVWPDGSAGTYTTDTINTTWQSADAWHITHTASGLTVTQAAITRNGSGDITAIPALTVA